MSACATWIEMAVTACYYPLSLELIEADSQEEQHSNKAGKSLLPKHSLQPEQAPRVTSPVSQPSEYWESFYKGSTFLSSRENRCPELKARFSSASLGVHLLVLKTWQRNKDGRRRLR